MASRNPVVRVCFLSSTADGHQVWIERGTVLYMSQKPGPLRVTREYKHRTTRNTSGGAPWHYTNYIQFVHLSY